MIAVRFEILILFFAAAGMALVFGLWLYYDWRDAKRFGTGRPRMVFHCVKCGCVYASRENETAECPRCGMENGKLKF